MSSENDSFSWDDFLQGRRVNKLNRYLTFIFASYEILTEYSCCLLVLRSWKMTAFNIVRLYKLFSLMAFRNLSSETSEFYSVSLCAMFLGVFAKLLKLISFVSSLRPSVRPNGITLLPLEAFPWNLISEIFFRKICPEDSTFIKI
jgi:hypothetical protein